MAQEEVSDPELVARAREGDDAALDEIYRRFTPLVTAIARRHLRRPTDIEDTVQETFLIVLEKLWQLERGDALRGWICRIALHSAHRRLRDRWQEQEDACALEELTASDATPEHNAELALISRALRVPREAHAAWVLRHVLGERLHDVARACQCSLATVKRRVAHVDAIVARFVMS